MQGKLRCKSNSGTSKWLFLPTDSLYPTFVTMGLNGAPTGFWHHFTVSAYFIVTEFAIPQFHCIYYSFLHRCCAIKNRFVLTCKSAMNKKKTLAYRLNCSNRNFGRKESQLYLAVLEEKEVSIWFRYSSSHLQQTVLVIRLIIHSLNTGRLWLQTAKEQ